MKVEFISATQAADGRSAEALIAYLARVSSPNQNNPKIEGLLKYCMKHGHWSVFEMADMTVEIETSRAIAQQILRHKSFSYQEFSQRYAEVSVEPELYEARLQDYKNRQNSLPVDDVILQNWWRDIQFSIAEISQNYYEQALHRGIAKECARMILPLSTHTKLYMKGSVRSWIHYFKVRCDESTQKEHRDIAIAIKDKIFKLNFPIISKAMEEFFLEESNQKIV